MNQPAVKMNLQSGYVLRFANNLPITQVTFMHHGTFRVKSYQDLIQVDYHNEDPTDDGRKLQMAKDAIFQAIRNLKSNAAGSVDATIGLLTMIETQLR